MGRKRSISTDISTDHRVALLAQKAGPLGVLLFTWLIPHADDWGRFIADPVEVKLTVLPAFDVTPEEVDSALKAMAEVGLIILYEVDGKRYLSFKRNSFYKYQNYIPVNKRKTDNSQYPPPPDSTPETTASNREDAPVLEQPTEDNGQGKNNSTMGTPPQESHQRPKIQEVYAAEFEQFWALYPRKVEKRSAYKAWRARIREGISPGVLIIAAKHYAEYCALNRLGERYIKHPANFLGSSRAFEDYIKPRAEPINGNAKEDKYKDLYRLV